MKKKKITMILTAVIIIVIAGYICSYIILNGVIRESYTLDSKNVTLISNTVEHFPEEPKLKYRYLISFRNKGLKTLHCDKLYICLLSKEGECLGSSISNSGDIPALFTQTFSVATSEAPFYIQEHGVYSIEAFCYPNQWDEDEYAVIGVDIVENEIYEKDGMIDVFEYPNTPWRY